MGTPEWQWWKEFEATEARARRTRWQEVWQSPGVRWVVLAGWLALAGFKFADGAWLFGLAYLACAVGFFVAYGVEARRRRRGPGGPDR
ncbi:MAG: hypothetical protein ABR511_01595 [Acidimicrobiales bacterium]